MADWSSLPSVRIRSSFTLLLLLVGLGLGLVVPARPTLAKPRFVEDGRQQQQQLALSSSSGNSGKSHKDSSNLSIPDALRRFRFNDQSGAHRTLDDGSSSSSSSPESAQAGSTSSSSSSSSSSRTSSGDGTGGSVDVSKGAERLADIVLAVTVDGAIHALRRDTGLWVWSVHGEDESHQRDEILTNPLVRSTAGGSSSTSTSGGRTNVTDNSSSNSNAVAGVRVGADGRAADREGSSSSRQHTDSSEPDEVYVIEPHSGGDIFVYHRSTGLVQRLPLSIAQLVDLSPFTFPAASEGSAAVGEGKLFAGKKETKLVGIDLASGKLVGVFGPEVGWCDWLRPRQTLFADGDSIDNRPADLLYLGRTEYSLSIYSKSQGLLQSLAYTSYGPSSLSASSIPSTPNDRSSSSSSSSRSAASPVDGPSDGRHFQPMHDGALVCFEDGSDALRWTNRFPHPVIAVYDIVYPDAQEDTASATNVQTGQDGPDCASAPSERSGQPSLVPHAQRNLHGNLQALSNMPPTTFIGKISSADDPTAGTVDDSDPDDGGYFAMSNWHYPLVAFANPPPDPPSSGESSTGGKSRTIHRPLLGSHRIEEPIDSGRTIDPKPEPLTLDPAPGAQEGSDLASSTDKTVLDSLRDNNAPRPPSRFLGLGGMEAPGFTGYLQGILVFAACLVLARALYKRIKKAKFTERALGLVPTSRASRSNNNGRKKRRKRATPERGESGSVLLANDEDDDSSSSDDDDLNANSDSAGRSSRRNRHAAATQAEVTLDEEKQLLKHEEDLLETSEQRALRPSTSNVADPSKPPAYSSNGHDKTGDRSTKHASSPSIDKALPALPLPSPPIYPIISRSMTATPEPLSAKVDAGAAAAPITLPPGIVVTGLQADNVEDEDDDGSEDDEENGNADGSGAKANGLRKKKGRRRKRGKRGGAATGAGSAVVGVSRVVTSGSGASSEATKEVLDAQAASTVAEPKKVIDEDKRVAGQVGNLIVSDKIIGYGSHGTVVLKGTFQGRAVAVKRLLKDFVTVASHEVKLLQESDVHTNVIRYFCKEQHDNFLYIALEECTASLYEVIDAPSKWNALTANFDSSKALRQITRGLLHLHKLKIIHRDLKPQNILIASSSPFRIVISDFGLCKKLDIDESSFLQSVRGGGMNAPGSFGYRAPEVLRGEVDTEDLVNTEDGSPASGTSEAESTSSSAKSTSTLAAGKSSSRDGSSAAPTGRKLTRSIDIFSLGCIFYFVLTNGDHPFGSRYEREVNILNDKLCLQGLSVVTENKHEAEQIVRRMCHADPGQRPSAAETLLDPFFWPSHVSLSFLCDASDRFEIMDKDTSPTIRDLEAGAEDIVGRDWLKNSLDRHLVDNLGKYRKYDAGSVRDLLRVIRNKRNHFQDLPENVRKSLGEPPAAFLAYFTKRFPKLLLHVHGVVKLHLGHEAMFNRYFELQEDL